MDARAAVGRALVLLAFAALVYGVFCTVLLGLERGLGASSGAAAAAGAVAAGLLLVAAFGHDRMRGLRIPLVDRVAATGARSWILGWIAAGCLLRLAWAAVFPPVPTSDYRSYLVLAVNLVERGEYWIGHTCFFRPPGMALALAPLVAVLGCHPAVPLLLNLLLFAAALPVGFLLARRLAGAGVARWTVAVLALWPNLVLLAGFASKELLLLVLVPGVLLLYGGAADRAGRPRAAAWSTGAGVLLGAAVLSQPPAALLVGALAVFEWLRGGRVGRALGRLAVTVAAAALVVLPWTVRNYLASGEIVPVSANGGHALWVGNNPRATGGYVSVRGPSSELGEIAYDRAALGWALAWIRANPGSFVRLLPRKQILYLGDDADGAYTSLRRGLGIGGLPYALAKGASNAWWAGVLGLAAVAVWRRRRELEPPTAALLMLPLLLQLALFSVTESGGRHHVALAALLAILAAMAVPVVTTEPPPRTPAGADRRRR